MNRVNKVALVEELFNLVYVSFDFEKMIRNYGTNSPVTSSEIHLIKNIAENESCYVTKLAGIMEISKAAISRMVIKLEKKGFVTKRADPDNNSRFILILTKKGEAAHREHLKIRKDLQCKIVNLLSSTSDSSVQEMFRFFSETIAEINKKM